VFIETLYITVTLIVPGRSLREMRQCRTFFRDLTEARLTSGSFQRLKFHFQGTSAKHVTASLKAIYLQRGKGDIRETLKRFEGLEKETLYGDTKVRIKFHPGYVPYNNVA
jgi:hypothetical protein